MNRAHTQSGFILIYVVVAITIFVALATSVVSSTVSQVELGAQELATARATMVTDMALECASYYATHPAYPFFTNTLDMTISCGPGQDMSFQSVGDLDPNSNACTAHTFISPDLKLTDSCARLVIETKPRTITVTTPAGDSVYNFCALRIQANGYSGACPSPDAGGQVSEGARTRWEEIGGFNSNSNVSVSANVQQASEIVPPEDFGPGGTPVAGQNKIVELDKQNISGILQLVHGATDLMTRTNPLQIVFKHDGANYPTGNVIRLNVTYSNALKNKIVEANPGEPGTPKFDIRDAETGQLVQGGLSVTKKYAVSLGLPSNLPEDIYLVRVTAWYLNVASSSIIVPLEVTPSTRGQL